MPLVERERGVISGATMRRRRLALVVHATVVTFVSMILAWPHPASSSPCRPERGFRNVEALPLDLGMLEFMQEVQFAKTPTLYTGPVCTENLNPDVVVMKSAKDRV